jgi:hypothetical protein
VKTKSRKRLWLWAAISVALLFVFSICVPVFTGVSERSPQTRHLCNAKQVALCCKTYAQDNEGRFPKSLLDLLPDYLSDDKVLYYWTDGAIPKNSERYDTDEFNTAFRAVRKLWHYRAGVTEKTPADWFLLWSVESWNGRRIFVRCDASGGIMREEEFRAEMKRQGRERELQEAGNQ